MDQEENHKAGFVSIIGKPNVGKSTLMNALVGERLSIITSKAQTTRHRIMGILSGEDFQIVYSDTPGTLVPQYELQKSMMRFVNSSLEDADIILYVTDLYEKEEDESVLSKLHKSDIPVLLALNKVDQAKGTQAEDKLKHWKDLVKPDHWVIISALEKINVDQVFQIIMEHLPHHPPYFPKDELTDKPERFFAAEIIREQIFLNYKKEVPYSCEVIITEFNEDEDIIRMRAEIYVERKSQKGIIIGKGGEALKKVGTAAREQMEKFFLKKVFLEQFVKVEPDWRKKQAKLNRFGYNQ
jgi:GTP-binding protein Era